MNIKTNQLLQLSSFMLLSLFIAPKLAIAQLIPDNTLGVENSTVLRSVQINGINSDRINGGARRGVNLFHSFSQFNIETGRGAYFSNPTGVTNILTRVTGGNISNIFGILGVEGNANLYLINPSGIYFGNGAKIDIKGTFIGTTADGISLGENDVYSASDPLNSNLLAIAPGAFFSNQFKNKNTTIINEGKLEINSGGNIILSADSIQNNGEIITSGGNVFLESTNGDINVQNISTIDNFNGGGNITLLAQGSIVVSGTIDASGGNFNVNNITDLLDIFPSIIGESGNITLTATKNINFNNNSALFAIGQIGGGINLQAQGKIKALNAFIRSRSTGNELTKSGQDVNISANTIDLKNTLLGSVTEGNTSAGNVNINANFLRLIQGGQIRAITYDQGETKKLTVTAKKIEIIGTNSRGSFPSGLLNLTFQKGNSDSIIVNTDLLRVKEGGQVSTVNLGAGKGGDITISAKEIELDGIGIGPQAILPSGLNSDAFTFGSNRSTGSAGNINIVTQILTIKNQATIGSSNFMSSRLPGLGKTGNITIKAKEINLDRGRIKADGNQQGGGNITIDSSKFIILRNRSEISTSVGQAIGFSGGNLNINTPLIVALPKGNKISATAVTSQGGNININANAILGYPQNLSIDASSQLGIDGSVNINGFTNLDRQLSEQEPKLTTKTALEVAECPLNINNTMQAVQSNVDLGAERKVKIFIPKISYSSEEMDEKASSKINFNSIVSSNTMVEKNGTIYLGYICTDS